MSSEIFNGQHVCPNCFTELKAFKKGDQMFCACDGGHWEYANPRFTWVEDKIDKSKIKNAGFNMKTYGGSFEKSIGEALLCADKDNLDKLVKTFPEIIKKFERW